MNLLLEKIDEAVKDFEESVKLSPNFPVSEVQKCYTGKGIMLLIKIER